MTLSPPVILHASAVSLNDYAVLIRGASGSGKSALALQLMGLGCDLVADDQCQVFDKQGAVWVQAPDSLPALIEARGVGLLPATLKGPAKLALVVDMDVEGDDRLPEPMETQVAGHPVPLINKARGPHFPSAVLLYLKGTFPA